MLGGSKGDDGCADNRWERAGLIDALLGGRGLCCWVGEEMLSWVGESSGLLGGRGLCCWVGEEVDC